MSARTEQLLTEISLLENQIAKEPAGSSKGLILKDRLKDLQQQLTQANDALTEGRQILKG